MKMDLQQLALVGLGGLVGAILRFLVVELTASEKFPVGTLAVNLIGSFILGALLFTYIFTNSDYSHWRAFLGIGLLGAFTTMSTFSGDTLKLLEDSENMKAGLNILLNTGGCLGAVFLGRGAALLVGS